MIEIGQIVGAIEANRVRITDHADEEAVSDSISIPQLLERFSDSEIVEQYPDDKPYPSCLIWSESNGPVHSVWAYNAKTAWAILVTVYRPDPQRWINWRVRRPRS